MRTDAFLAVPWLSGNSKRILFCYARAICACIVSTLVLYGWRGVKEMCHQFNPCRLWWGEINILLCSSWC